ncbi:hypothetical protein ACI65C_001506 [Semiaphis heraclei]
MGGNSESNDEDDPNNDSYIEITEDNIEITKGNNNEGQTNLDWSSDTSNIENNTFRALAMAPRKKKKKEKDQNEIRVSQAYENAHAKTKRESKENGEGRV